ncbi:MAG: Asp-tRNA(Asn)/Glu-tRNA(Gln) amidotransferase subunit GatC [bacterium]|nr:Asp-tRNA(Asn)/Glu-tRNA(Gln) amidotransferase subunit GatC [bacterium]
MAEITKQLVEHLADLARLELDENEAGKFTDDLGKILAHVKELQSVDTKNIAPMTGGTMLTNAFRSDEEPQGDMMEVSRKIIAEFPESEGGYNKIPPVFE